MLIQSIKKEAIIIANDLHSLAVLILLPITFMLIMTLAMGEKQQDLVNKVTVNISSEQDSQYLAPLALYLQSSGLSVNLITPNKTSSAGALVGNKDDALGNSSDINNADVNLTIQAGFQDNLLLRQGQGKLSLDFTDKSSPQTRLMVVELVKVALSKLKLHAYMQDVGDFDDNLTLADKVTLVNKSASVNYLLAEEQQEQIFSAPTLYSIPSWLIFGLYFIVLPISTTLIKEKENGTLVRIQTYPISTQYYFFNKALSYSVVSLFQWFLLSCVGLLCVPWLTGQDILVINNPSLYLVSAFFIIFSAIGFAFLLASLVSTFEQAIVLGGGINILLAALSGFMVPIDIMPSALATIATFSPMYWSADLLKQGLAGVSFAQALPNILLLSGFGSLCFISALIIFKNKTRKLSWR